MRRKRPVLMLLLLLAALIVGTGLWLRALRRQYVLNRALIAALVKGDEKQAIALVKAGADPNTRYKVMPAPTLFEVGQRFFHHAPPPVNKSPTALLIACGVAWDTDEDTFAMQSPDRPDYTELIQAMLDHGAQVNVSDKGERTPLNLATLMGYEKTARLLIDHGADVRLGDQNGITPLMRAVTECPDLVETLLDHGSNVNAETTDGSTALCDALKAHQLDSIGRLLAHGANPNSAGSAMYTPLQIAQHDNRPDIVALLKRYGAKK